MVISFKCRKCGVVLFDSNHVLTPRGDPFTERERVQVVDDQTYDPVGPISTPSSENSVIDEHSDTDSDLSTVYNEPTVSNGETDSLSGRLLNIDKIIAAYSSPGSSSIGTDHVDNAGGGGHVTRSVAGSVRDDTCERGLWFLDPEHGPSWLLTILQQAGFKKGRLKCEQCGNRFGSFDFLHTSQCCCQQHVLPPVHVTCAKVDPTNVLRRRPHQLSHRSGHHNHNSGTNMTELYSENLPEDRYTSAENMETDGHTCVGNFHEMPNDGDEISENHSYAEENEDMVQNSFSYHTQLDSDNEEYFPRNGSDAGRQASSLSYEGLILITEPTPGVTSNIQSQQSNGSLLNRRSKRRAAIRRRSRIQNNSSPDEDFSNDTAQQVGIESTARDDVTSDERISAVDDQVEDNVQGGEIIGNADQPCNHVPTTGSSIIHLGDPNHLVDNDILTCPVCLDLYYHPQLCEPCQHVFCDPCLRRLRASVPQSTRCPLCRVIIAKCSPDKNLTNTIRNTFPKEYKKRSSLEKQQHRRLPSLPGNRRNSLRQFLRGSRNRRNNPRMMVLLAQFAFFVLLVMFAFTVFATTVGFLLWYILEVTMDITLDLLAACSDFWDYLYQAIIIWAVNGQLPPQFRALLSNSLQDIGQAFVKMWERGWELWSRENQYTHIFMGRLRYHMTNGTNEFLSKVQETHIAHYIIMGCLSTFLLYRLARYVQRLHEN